MYINPSPFDALWFFIFYSSQQPHNTVNYALESATYNSQNGPVDVIAFFQIAASTGEISLRQSIATVNDGVNQYTVSIS